MILGLLSTLSFVVVSVLVFSNVTQPEDAQLALTINGASIGAALNAMLVLVTRYGREYFWISVVGVMLVFGSRGTKYLAIELAILFVAGIAFGEITKFTLYRPRPFEGFDSIVLRVPIDNDSSFPSGHALIVSVGATFSVLKFNRKPISALFVSEAAIVCYSRVYVGMHYPLDVIAGLFLGIGIAGIGLYVLDKYFGGALGKVAARITGTLGDGPLELSK